MQFLLPKSLVTCLIDILVNQMENRLARASGNKSAIFHCLLMAPHENENGKMDGAAEVGNNVTVLSPTTGFSKRHCFLLASCCLCQSSRKLKELSTIVSFI